MERGGAFDAIHAAFLQDEADCVKSLMRKIRDGEAQQAAIAARGTDLVEATRARLRENRGLATLLQEYDLSSAEGVLLMCLAESLLRIPDSYTADRLIQDKLSQGQWERHFDDSRTVTVNAATWGLMLTGRWVQWEQAWERNPLIGLRRLAARLGDVAMRSALRRSMAVLARQFVMGEDITSARRETDPGLRYSFDCLGEAARTAADAQRYFESYADAIRQLADAGNPQDPVAAPGISVKLSALHPRYEFNQRGRVLNELVPRLRELVVAARAAGINLTLDAEEADRLVLSLEVFEAVYVDAALQDWEGFGLAVQAYQKRALPVLEWVAGLSREQGRRIPVRLVKGAYWDMEIKRAQERGLSGYPVFTRKAATDVSYQDCARYMLKQRDVLYPQFATHNAYTVAWILAEAGQRRDFEFQRLHGMGEALYASLREQVGSDIHCRVYAPIGPYRELLPYLVRRLLENGANSSFVNRIGHEEVPVAELVEDPVASLQRQETLPHPSIPLPRDLYGGRRRNSQGIDFSDVTQWHPLQASIEQAVAGFPLVAYADGSDNETPYVIRNPANRDEKVGEILEADSATVDQALKTAYDARLEWDATPAGDRADCLEWAADLIESRRGELMALIVREGGRCLPDALSEVREAADFCRYYAMQARRGFAGAESLPGPTGEDNSLRLHGRGVFLCISPWNFPLAIFTGQVAAALAAGNAVLAKPARQTPLVARAAVALLHEAGVPEAVLQLLPGPGGEIGNQLLGDERIAGVAFTGSTATARSINQRLAQRAGPIVPLIAETGGQNVMIVDSSALPEQVVMDVIGSAFTSAGQRCSALRVLFLQEEIADGVLEMLAGAMDELVIGDPLQLATDIGPVIDAMARDKLQDHADWLEHNASCIKVLDLPDDTANGTFFAPRVYEIPRLDLLSEEIFGPILHVIRYPAGDLDRVVDAVNATGYGLTLGVHSRIEAHWERLRARSRVGNLYINRNMIGAVVGVQPFGGEGLSGTGPKAGGPHYLYRFATERSVSINTAAIGGNAGLLGMENPSADVRKGAGPVDPEPES